LILILLLTLFFSTTTINPIATFIVVNGMGSRQIPGAI
jgi:hypothetical protein